MWNKLWSLKKTCLFWKKTLKSLKTRKRWIVFEQTQTLSETFTCAQHDLRDLLMLVKIYVNLVILRLNWQNKIEQLKQTFELSHKNHISKLCLNSNQLTCAKKSIKPESYVSQLGTKRASTSWWTVYDADEQNATFTQLYSSRDLQIGGYIRNNFSLFFF